MASSNQILSTAPKEKAKQSAKVHPSQSLGGSFEFDQIKTSSIRTGNFEIKDLYPRSFPSTGSIDFSFEAKPQNPSLTKSTNSQPLIQMGSLLTDLGSGANLIVDIGRSATNEVAKDTFDLLKMVAGKGEYKAELNRSTPNETRKQEEEKVKVAVERRRQENYTVTLTAEQAKVSLVNFQEYIANTSESAITQETPAEIGLSSAFDANNLLKGKRRDVPHLIHWKKLVDKKARENAERQQSLTQTKGPGGANLSLNLSAQEGNSMVANSIASAG